MFYVVLTVPSAKNLLKIFVMISWSWTALMNILMRKMKKKQTFSLFFFLFFDFFVVIFVKNKEQW